MSGKSIKANRFGKPRFRAAPVAAVVAVGLSALLVAMAPRGANSGPVPTGSPKKAQLPVVKVNRVRRGRVTQWLTAPGRIECHPDGLETLTARVRASWRRCSSGTWTW